MKVDKANIYEKTLNLINLSVEYGIKIAEP